MGGGVGGSGVFYQQGGGGGFGGIGGGGGWGVLPSAAVCLAGDGSPVGEEVAVIGAVVDVGCDGEAGEEGACGGLGRDAGLSF